MKTKLITGLLLAASCMFAAPRVSIGIGVGAPVPAYGYYAAPAYVPPAYVAPAYVPPPAPVVYGPPAPGYTWTAGYWYGVGPHRVWRPGYWVAPRARYFGARERFRR